MDPDLLTDKILDMMLFHSVQSLAERKSRSRIFRGVALSFNSEALLVNHWWPLAMDMGRFLKMLKVRILKTFLRTISVDQVLLDRELT